MTTRLVKVQLAVFALVTVLVVWYGATRYLGIGSVIHPPYEVGMVVEDSGGLYPRADVDLLGTRVGRVKEIQAGPGTHTTVVLAIDDGVEIPRDVRAIVAAKSAIGEGYVQLEPRSASGPLLADGDTIDLADTVSPTRLDDLLVKLDALAGSIPLSDLDTVLRESEVALRDLGPSVGRLVDGSQVLASDALANIEDTTALLRDARTVLATQAELAPQTIAWARELSALTTRLRELDPTVISLYDTGLRASTGVTNLLADNQALLPVLLDNLTTVTTVARTRIPQLRKTLIMFPWILENQVNSARFCDDYDPQTGEAVESTCHYDEDGLPIYSLHLAQQLDKMSGNPYQSCTKGYEGTTHYEPGPRSPKPNLRAHCAAQPDDPVAPSVRGAQNVTTPAYARRGPGPAAAPGTTVIYDPSTGLVTDGDAAARISGVHGPPPPSGDAGLAWLLTHQLEDS